MASLGKTAVSIRIFSTDLDPDEITLLLGCAPTASARRGDIRKSVSQHRIVERHGSWRLSVDDRSPGDLSEQILSLLAKLTDDMSVWRTLSLRHQCDVFCGLFMFEGNEGLGLSPELLAMLGARGLSLEVDIYGPLAD